MSQETFRRLIILQWVLGIASCIVYFATIEYLPPQFKNYLEELRNTEPTNVDWFVLGIGFLLFLAYIVIYIGLYKFRVWAKNLLVPIHIAALIMIPFYGETVETVWVSAINYLYYLVNGGILFLVYLPPVKQMFETNGNV